MKENIEAEISNVVLGIAGKSDRFKIKFCGINFRLSIKPITARNFIKVSGQLSHLQDINNDNDTMFQAAMQNATDLRYIARAIAISTNTFWTGIVTRSILGLGLTDIQTLFNIVIKQTDAQRFFFITGSGKKLNLLKKQEPEEA